MGNCSVVPRAAGRTNGLTLRHFDVVPTMPEWETQAAKLRAAGTQFVIEPCVRLKGQVGEQATMFFKDPCGNALEFQAFAERSQLFVR